MKSLAVTLVLDATPLIYLTKIGFWRRLDAFSFAIVTTPQVIEELDLEKNHFRDAAEIKALLRKKELLVETVEKIEPTGSLSVADVSVILLAKKQGAVAVIDDGVARNYALSLGVKTTFSSSLLIEGVRRKIFSLKQAEEYLDEMIAKGWFCDIATYKRIVEAIRK